MPRIIVENRTGLNTLLGEVQLFLDGRELMKIGRKEHADFSVMPGGHTLQARLGSTASPSVEFRIEDRETLGFACEVSGIFKKQLSLWQSFHRPAADRFGAAAHLAGSANTAAGQSSDEEAWNVVLDVPADAPMSEIRRAYLRLVWRHHPDRVSGLDTLEKIKAEQATRRLNVAYTAAKKRRRSN
jgi:hypothetical protein